MSELVRRAGVAPAQWKKNGGQDARLTIKATIQAFFDAAHDEELYHVVMTVEQLRNVHGAKPFRPFTIHMGDGGSFRVDHPEFMSRSPSGRTIVVHQQDDSFSVLDMLLVTELEVHPPSQPPREAAV